MMNIDELKNRFSSSFENYLALISEVFKNQFSRDLSATSSAVKDFNPQRDIQSIKGPVVALQLETTVDANIQHMLLIDPNLVLQMFAWMIDSDVDKAVTEEHLDGLKEIFNQMLGQLQSSLSAESVSLTFTVKDAHYLETVDASLFGDQTDPLVKADYTITVSDLKFAVRHVMAVDDTGTDTGNLDDELVDNIFPADFQKFNTPSINGDEPRNIEILMDVQLEIYVELGRKSMLIKDILKLSKGSIVELDKAAGEPLGMYVNGRKFAEGEVVVVDDQFGIRITQLIGPKERIKSLA